MSRRLVAATNRYLCTGWFLRKSLLPQLVAKNHIWQNLCDLLRRQRKFSPKILLYTRRHLSLRCVAATCCCNCSPDLHTKSDLSRWRVAATHHLVCFDLFALLVIRAPEIFYSRFATTWQGGHVGGQYNKQFFEELTWKTVYGSQMTAVTSRAKKSNTILKVKWNQFLRGDKSYLWGRQFCKEI